ncbi:MAG: hypothetical protein JWO91_2064 [Acidobacteriaceae bacterium]|nr:hypothetical protein [Acidobacteriaceae bacterium]
MKEAHARLNISEAQWDAMVSDFRKTTGQVQGAGQRTRGTHRHRGHHEKGHCETRGDCAALSGVKFSRVKFNTPARLTTDEK